MTANQEPVRRDPGGGRLLDVIVVGGSQAGLAMAWHLAQQGLGFVVLEAGQKDQAPVEVDDELTDVENTTPRPGTVIRPIVPLSVTVPSTRSTISPALIVPVTDSLVTEL